MNSHSRSAKTDKYTVRWEYRIPGEVYSVALTPDAHHIVAGTWDNGIYLFNEHGDPIRNAELRGAMGPAIIYGDQTSIASISQDGGLTFFDLSGQSKSSWELDVRAEQVFIKATDDGRYIALSEFGGRLRFLDRQEQRELWSFEEPVYHVALCPGVGRIAAASLHHCVFLLNWDGQLIWRYEGRGVFVGTAISADGRIIVAGGEGTQLHCLDAEKNVLWIYEHGRRWFYGVAMTPGAGYIAAGTGGVVYLLDGNGQLLWEHPIKGDSYDVAITPDGKFIAVGTNSGEIILLENLLPPVSSAITSGPFADAIARAHVTRQR